MSDRARQEQIERIVEQARRLPAANVAAFLQQACGSEATLRREVESRLRESEPEPPEAKKTPGDGIQGARRGGSAESVRPAVGQVDRNLLYGVLAVQVNFITPQQLTQAMQTWLTTKSRGLEKILLEQGALAADAEQLLTALIDQHILQLGSAGTCLEQLSSVGDVRQALANLNDSDLDRSLAVLRSPDDTAGSMSTGSVMAGTTVGDPSRTAGRFKILRPHAKGGLGEISLAHDGELNRTVALKEIRREFADQELNRDRFMLEAEVTGGLEHPGIVPVYGLGHYDDGRPFYVMRFIEGDSLKQAIRQFYKRRTELSPGERNIELRRLLRRFVDVCEAIHYAHSRQVLHRDLKPGNIMLGKYGETLVVDWGLARTLGRSDQPYSGPSGPLVPSSGSKHAPTMAGTMIGTPAYMSPEQAEGRHGELGPATDVYSLGATLYCILTGQPPFTDKETEEILSKVRHGDFPAPREVDPEVPGPLAAICLRAMRLNPAERYNSTQDVADDVERWLADEPVSVYRDSWLDRVSRFARRNRTTVATTAAVFLMGILGLGLLNWVTRAKNAQLRAANAELDHRNSQLAQLNTDLENAQKTATSNFERTRKLAMGLASQVEGDVAQLPKAELFRRWLANQVYRVMSELVDSNPDNPAVLDDFVQTARYAANIERFLGERGEETRTKYTGAIASALRRVELQPESPLAKDQLAESYLDFASFLRLNGDLIETRRQLVAAEALVEQLRTSDPQSLPARRTAVTVANELGSVAYELGEFSTAATQQEKACSILRELAANPGAIPMDFGRLALFLAGLAQTLRESAADLAKARTIAAEAVVVGRNNLKLSPPMDLFPHGLSRGLMEIALLEGAGEGSNELAVAACDEAIQNWKTLAEKKTAPGLYTRYYGLALNGRAQLHLKNGELEQAAQACELAEQQVRRLVEALPQNLEAHEALATVLQGKSQVETARGNVAAAAAATTAAIRELSQASSLAPSNRRLQLKLESLRK